MRTCNKHLGLFTSESSCIRRCTHPLLRYGSPQLTFTPPWISGVLHGCSLATALWLSHKACRTSFSTKHICRHCFMRFTTCPPEQRQCCASFPLALNMNRSSPEQQVVRQQQKTTNLQNQLIWGRSRCWCAPFHGPGQAC